MLSELAIPHIRCCLSAIPSDLMKSTVVDESLSSMNLQFCSKENQLLQLLQQNEKPKSTHNFIICDQLPEMELIFGINIQRKFLISYAWDKEKNCYIQKEGKFLTYTKNCEQKATIGTVKSILKIPP